ncbi:MAG: polymerase sliding clamp subunit [Verrucomicrobiales bacterium]|nr:polymerase sliding clamp subunit [Verrucomicrobiales bacterium]
MKSEIEIPVAVLKTVLPGLSKIVVKKPTLPILGCVKVRQENKRIVIEATNLDETVYYGLPNQTNGVPGEIIVLLDDLSKVVKRCSAKDVVRLAVVEEKTLIRYSLAGGFVDEPVETIPGKEWPVVPILKSEDIPLPKGFKETLRQAMECASTDNSRYVLNGACLDVTTSDKAHYIVGTDGHQLFAANSFTFKLDASVLISTRRFLAWPGFMDDGEWRLKVLPKAESHSPWVQITSDNWVYVARQIDGNFPNWKQVVPRPNSKWTHITLDESAADLMLGTIPMLPGRDRQHEPIELEVRENSLFVKGTGNNGNHGQAKINGATIVGKSVEVSLNRNYMLKALRFGFRTFEIDDSLSPMLFTNGGKTMVVMPVRGPAAPVPVEGKQPDNSSPAAAHIESPKENAPAVVPSTAAAETKQTEETKPMPETLPTAQRGNLKSHQPDNAETSAIKELIDRVESIKTSMRDVLNDLHDTAPLLKQALKEQKATEKEIETVRSALRSIQRVEI